MSCTYILGSSLRTESVYIIFITFMESWINFQYIICGQISLKRRNADYKHSRRLAFSSADQHYEMHNIKARSKKWHVKWLIAMFRSKHFFVCPNSLINKIILIGPPISNSSVSLCLSANCSAVCLSFTERVCECRECVFICGAAHQCSTLLNVTACIKYMVIHPFNLNKMIYLIRPSGRCWKLSGCVVFTCVLYLICCNFVIHLPLDFDIWYSRWSSRFGLLCLTKYISQLQYKAFYVNYATWILLSDALNTWSSSWCFFVSDGAPNDMSFMTSLKLWQVYLS